MPISESLEMEEKLKDAACYLSPPTPAIITVFILRYFLLDFYDCNLNTTEVFLLVVFISSFNITYFIV